MLSYFNITQQGSSHASVNKVCQDYSCSKSIQLKDNKELVIAAVADGVGSCDYSQYGSKIAVNSFLKSVEYNLASNNSHIENDGEIENLIRHAFNYALSEINKDSEARELPFLEYDTTLSGAIYDGANLWFGHIGDSGIVVLHVDGSYELITKRHKGEEVGSVYPLRNTDLWQFGKVSNVASCCMMTDGILDFCVDNEGMNNRVYFPFLRPILTTSMNSDNIVATEKENWASFLNGTERNNLSDCFEKNVTDDKTILTIQNSNLVDNLPTIDFDFKKWDEETEQRKKQLNTNLYKEYNAYKEELKDVDSANRNNEQNDGQNDDQNDIDKDFEDAIKSSNINCANSNPHKEAKSETAPETSAFKLTNTTLKSLIRIVDDAIKKIIKEIIQ